MLLKLLNVSRPRRSAAGLVAGLVLAGLVPMSFAGGAAGVAQRGAAVPASVRAGITFERVDQMLRTMPQGSLTFTALRTNYPAEYRALIQHFVTIVRSGASMTAAQQSSFAGMRAFMASKVGALSAAPEADLVALAAAYDELSELLANSNVALCAQWTTTGFGPASRPPMEVLAKLDRINAVQILAMHHGEAPGAVARPPVGEEDRQALMEGVQAIDPAAALLLGSGALPTATPAQQCQAGRALYRAVAAMPPARAAAVTAFMLQEFFRAQPPVPAR